MKIGKVVSIEQFEIHLLKSLPASLFQREEKYFPLLPSGSETALGRRPKGDEGGLDTLFGRDKMLRKVIFKIILTLFFVGPFITGGIVLMEPELSFGQPKKRTVISGEVRKDPFSPPPGVRLLSKEISVQEDKKLQPIAEIKPTEIKPVEAPLKLKAILIGDHIRLASIDRSIVTVGDSVNGEKVLEIQPDRVILGKEGKKRTLLLDQSPIKLTVEER